MKQLKKLCIFVLVLAMMTVIVACNGAKPAANKATTTKAPAAEATTTQAPATEATTTAAPAGSEQTGDVLTEQIVTVVDSLSEYTSIGENFGWQNAIYTLGEGNTGKQYVSYIVTPLIDGVDGSVSFADGDTEVLGFPDLSVMVRLQEGGFFDVRNGDKFEKLAEVKHSANKEYFVEIFADMDAKTYTVYVTPPDGEKTMIAENFAFRTSANTADDLGKMFVISAHANNQLAVKEVKRYGIYEPTKTYWSTGENMGWQNKGLLLDKDYTGKIKIEYDVATVLDSVDGSVDFTQRDLDVSGFPDLAMLIRMNQQAKMFDVRNGDVFEKIADVPVEKDKKYHVEVQADIDAKTYSVWVTPEGGSKTKIADNYSFRTSANHIESVGKVFVISAHENDSIKLENLKIEEIK